MEPRLVFTVDWPLPEGKAFQLTTRYPDGSESIEMPMPDELESTIAARIEQFTQLQGR